MQPRSLVRRKPHPPCPETGRGDSGVSGWSASGSAGPTQRRTSLRNHVKASPKSGIEHPAAGFSHVHTDRATATATGHADRPNRTPSLSVRDRRRPCWYPRAASRSDASPAAVWNAQSPNCWSPARRSSSAVQSPWSVHLLDKAYARRNRRVSHQPSMTAVTANVQLLDASKLPQTN